MTTKDTKRRAAARSAKPTSRSLLDCEGLRELYLRMERCRALEERALRLTEATPSPRRRRRPWRPGLEAIHAACAMNLCREDVVVSPPNELTMRYMLGEPLAAIFSALPFSTLQANGRRVKGRPSPSVAIEQARRLKGTGNIALAFARPPATSSSWLKAMDRAAAEELPLIVFRGRPDFGTTKPQSRRWIAPSPSLDPGSPEQRQYPAIPVDGCDAVAIYRVSYETIARARSGRGPTLIDCEMQPILSRIDEGPDHPMHTDPIEYMRRYLEHRGIYEKTRNERSMRAFVARMEAAIVASRSRRRNRRTEV